MKARPIVSKNVVTTVDSGWQQAKKRLLRREKVIVDDLSLATITTAKIGSQKINKKITCKPKPSKILQLAYKSIFE